MELKVKDKLYYKGLGYGIEVFIYKIYTKNGIKMIHTNNGVHRKYDEVIKNECDLYTSKELLNKRLTSIGTRCILIP